MNEIIEAMERRRSIRNFLPELPSKEDLDLIAESGLYAASGMGQQAAITLVVTRRELRDRLSEALRIVDGKEEGFDPFYGAPALMVVLADAARKTRVYDGSLVLGNMMLAAHSLGLGSCWVHRAKQVFAQEEYKQLLKDLGIEGEYEGIAFLALGKIDGELPEAEPRRENAGPERRMCPGSLDTVPLPKEQALP